MRIPSYVSAELKQTRKYSSLGNDKKKRFIKLRYFPFSMLEKIAREGVQTLDGSEEGRPSARTPPRILYHGTCHEYLYRQLNRYGNYEHGTKAPVNLTDDVVEAMGFAMKRSEFYSDSPNILIVDTVKLVRYLPISEETPGRWSVDRLSKDCFLECPVAVVDGRVGNRSARLIKELADEFLNGKLFREYVS